MFKLPFKSLGAKLILVVGCAIALVLTLSNAYVIWKTSERMVALTMDDAKAESRSIAYGLTTDISLVVGSVRTMAHVLEEAYDGQSMDYDGVANALKANITQTSFAFGSWFCERPEGFKLTYDADAAPSTQYRNEKGIFTPYWRRDGAGNMSITTFESDYSKDWYALAATSKQGAITPAYLSSDVNMPNVMVSLTQAVVSNSQVMGVTGVDISLSQLTERLKTASPFPNGRVTLVSQTGSWLVAPDPSLLMTQYAEDGAAELKEAMETKELRYVKNLGLDTEHPFNRLMYPFDVPEMNATWVILLDVPLASLNAPMQEQTMLMLLAIACVLITVLLVLAYSVGKLIRDPLSSLLKDVDSLRSGQYEMAVAGQDRSDETGKLAAALEGFRTTLAGVRQMEERAENERKQSEIERSRAEQDRAQATRVQQQVVTALGEGLTELSRGNLTYRIADDFPGDYAQLRRDFNDALASLEETIATVNMTVVGISGGTAEITKSARDLSQRTEQQAASLEQTAAALNQLTTQVNSSAENAAEAAQTVNIACDQAESSGKIVEQAVNSMQGISQSSQEISRIIGVIDEIAFQTNLLALNAGVEAARAGEAGKGFAVVAQEVRELAQRSATAAKEIKDLINTSSKQVGDGVELVGKAGVTMHKIAQQVMQINNLIRQISASATEQASGLKEVNTAMGQMDQVTQQNAAMVEETTAASVALSNDAENLKSQVTRFKANSRNMAPSQRSAAYRPAPTLVASAPPRASVTDTAPLAPRAKLSTPMPTEEKPAVPKAAPSPALKKSSAPAYDGNAAVAEVSDDWTEF